MWFNKRILVVAVVVIAGLLFAIHELRTNTVNAGFRAIRAGEYDTARRIFAGYAESGQPEGQYGLGLLHQKGWGARQDVSVAARWYRQSAEQNYPPAQLALAILLETGAPGVPKDTFEAHVWYVLAVDNRVHRGVDGRDRTRQIMSKADLARAGARIEAFRRKVPHREFSASKTLGVYP